MEKPEDCVHEGHVIAWLADNGMGWMIELYSDYFRASEARALAAWLPRAAAWVDAGGKEERRG